jgi:hypothetical protein
MLPVCPCRTGMLAGCSRPCPNASPSQAGAPPPSSIATATQRSGSLLRRHSPLQSAIDRFQNAAYDLVIEGESYRSRLKPTIEREGPTPVGNALSVLDSIAGRRARETRLSVFPLLASRRCWALCRSPASGASPSRSMRSGQRVGEQADGSREVLGAVPPQKDAVVVVHEIRGAAVPAGTDQRCLEFRSA